MKCAYLGNDFTIPAFGLSLVASLCLVVGLASHQNRKDIEKKGNLVREYESARVSGKEKFMAKLNVYSERTGDKRDCSFFGVDLDDDGTNDIIRTSVTLGRGMTCNDYADLRNK